MDKILSNPIYMDKASLKKLSKSELIKLLLKQEKKKPEIIAVDDYKRPIPTPRKSVKQMVKQYEENIILPPPEFRDNYKPVPAPRSKKPVPTPRTKIEQVDKALKGYTKSYEINIKNNKDPLVQMRNTRKTIESHINKLLNETKGLKYVETLKVTFKKLADDEAVYKSAYFNSSAQTIINQTEIIDSSQSAKQQILNKVAEWISQGSGWTIKSVDSHYLNIVKYKPLKGSSYIQLPQELRNSAKGLINMKNGDNQCFRWCHIRHLNPQDKDPQRIKKTDKQYIEKLDYSGIEFPVNVKQFNTIEKQNNINISIFGYEDQQPFPIYVSKEKFEDHRELLLITGEGEELIMGNPSIEDLSAGLVLQTFSEQNNSFEDDDDDEEQCSYMRKTYVNHYVLIKDFNKFMFNQSKHKERKHFCMYCLQCFSSERILTNHKENCIQVNGQQAIKMPDVGNNVLKFENYHKQLPVPFVIYADFEAITKKVQGCIPSDEKSYTEAYPKHKDCGYGYKVVCCYDDEYTKPEQIYRGENAVHLFMEAMLKEVKYCKRVMDKHFNKRLIMTETDEEGFKKAKECHICEKKYTEKDIRARDHCHITGKYRGSAHQECNLRLKINQTISKFQ